MKKVLITMVLALGFVVSTSTADTKVFTYPKAGGVALDWCKTYAAGCGKPAADYFCRAKGFDKAVNFKIEENLGYTRIMKTGQICNDPACDSFRYIKCKRDGAAGMMQKPFKRFKNPKYQGIALDWCYTWASGCGTKVANEYCRSKGYPKGALRFKKLDNIGYTIIMRTGQICNSPGCDSFRYIDCKR